MCATIINSVEASFHAFFTIRFFECSLADSVWFSLYSAMDEVMSEYMTFEKTNFSLDIAQSDEAFMTTYRTVSHLHKRSISPSVDSFITGI